MSSLSKLVKDFLGLSDQGYYPKHEELIELINDGFNPIFHSTQERLYLKKGGKTTIVPQGYEGLVWNFYNAKNITQSGTQLLVFLSYSREDLQPAYTIYDFMVKTGIHVYMSELHPEPGITVWKKIEDAIRACDCVIVLWTHSGISSAFVNQEIGIAKALDKLIIPIVEEGVNTRGVLEGFEYIKFNRSNITETLDAISQTAYKILQKQKAESENNAKKVLAGLFLGLLFLAAISKKK